MLSTYIFIAWGGRRLSSIVKKKKPYTVSSGTIWCDINIIYLKLQDLHLFKKKTILKKAHVYPSSQLCSSLRLYYRQLLSVWLLKSRDWFKKKTKKKTVSLFLDLQQKDRVAHINTANWPKTHAAVKHLKQLKTAHYMNPRCGVSRTIPLHSMCNCLVLVQFVSVQYVLWISVSCWHVCSRVLPVQNRSHYCRLTQSVSASAS